MIYTALLLTMITLMGGFISTIIYRYIDAQKDFNKDIIGSLNHKATIISDIKLEVGLVSQKVDSLKHDIERTHEGLVDNFASEIEPLEKRVVVLESEVRNIKEKVA